MPLGRGVARTGEGRIQRDDERAVPAAPNRTARGAAVALNEGGGSVDPLMMERAALVS